MPDHTHLHPSIRDSSRVRRAGNKRSAPKGEWSVIHTEGVEPMKQWRIVGRPFNITMKNTPNKHNHKALIMGWEIGVV